VRRPFYQCASDESERARWFLEAWKDDFHGFYPDSDEGGPPSGGLRSILAEALSAPEYRAAVHEMRLSDLIVYLEERRVGRAFRKLSEQSAAPGRTGRSSIS